MICRWKKGVSNTTQPSLPYYYLFVLFWHPAEARNFKQEYTKNLRDFLQEAQYSRNGSADFTNLEMLKKRKKGINPC
tara:strand:- start:2072 stop:2302 length:231 start_codon:yes stop_codon:yes gene_type:complete